MGEPVQLNLFIHGDAQLLCVNCKGPAFDNVWGPWCQQCGGVCFKEGQIFFRHVATVYNEKDRRPIVFDLSSGDYAYILKEANPHAGELSDLHEFKAPPIQMAHGTLDAMIALAYPDVKDEGGPMLAASPFATETEKSLIFSRW